MPDDKPADASKPDKPDQAEPDQGGGPTESAAPELAASPPGEAPQEAVQARFALEAQYIKDLSFENPHAPASLVAAAQRPNINVNVEVQARPMQSDRYEVSLRITANTKGEEDVIFILDLTYCGVFTITDTPPDLLQQLLLIECPRMLFPFARRVVADATRDGGFPPLMLNPIDFVSMYRQKAEQTKNATTTPA